MRWFTQWLERLLQLGLDLMAQLVAGILRAPAVAASRAVAPILVRQGTGEDVLDVRHQVVDRALEGLDRRRRGWCRRFCGGLDGGLGRRLRGPLGLARRGQ